MTTPIITAHLGNPDARTMTGYQALGGYQSLRKALKMQRKDIVAEVKTSNLRGRGGAGFPTGIKWGFISPDATDVVLVCNADESEPGTCKDRELIYWMPHQLIEGCLITAYALKAEKVFIYIRGEMMREYKVLMQAVQEATQAGFIGDNVLGSDTKIDLIVHRGAGAYICGEETALLNSIEGRRGEPRIKPPFPAVVGVFQKPTVVNNTETLSNIPHIIEHGGQWFADLGTERSGGLRIVCVSGHVNKPGIYEIPMTMTFRELIEDTCDGVWKNNQIKAVIPGGSSMPPLDVSELDVPIEFDALMSDERIKPVEVKPGVPFDLGGGRKLRTMAGSGGIVVMDHTTDVVSVCSRIIDFYHHESCGQCTPCREGTGWLSKVGKRLARGEGKPGDVDLLSTIAQGIAGNTICALGDAAAWPVLGFITKFREDFENKINNQPKRVS